MISETPVAKLASTGVPSVMENALVATVMVGAAVVASEVPAVLRRVTDAALPLQAALTPVKLTAVMRYFCAVAS